MLPVTYRIKSMLVIGGGRGRVEGKHSSSMWGVVATQMQSGSLAQRHQFPLP
jgi:hypothetical protein